MNSLAQAFEKRKIQRNAYRKYREFNKKVDTSNFNEDFYKVCKDCSEDLNFQAVVANNFCCPKCDSPLRLRAIDRIKLTVDEDSFSPKGLGYKTKNPLNQKGYLEKIKTLKEKNEIEEAYVYGYCTINGENCIIGVMDSFFQGGSMGTVVGEKVTRSIELAVQKKMPLVLFAASGGARMQEGIYSLMQMAKTSQALTKLSDSNTLFISVLTNPTTGGVTASFASLGDIILAEPNALIGFAGPRVIETTINQKLPEGFQRAEFLEEKGFVDKVVKRQDLRDTLGKILRLHKNG